MGTHESLFRENFVKLANSLPYHEWVPNPNIVWKVARQAGANKASTASGKPDGYVLRMGQHYDVELKASGLNGLYDMGDPTLPDDNSDGPGWRQNQRKYYREHNLKTHTPYFIGIVMWGRGKAYSPWGRYVIMSADMYLDLEKWIFSNTGLRVLAYDWESGVGSRKPYCLEEYLKIRKDWYQQVKFSEMIWQNGGLKFPNNLSVFI